MEILKLDKLLKLLKSDSHRLRMWAAYQLLENHQHQAEVFVGQMLETEDEEIREPAVYLAGKMALERYSFTLLGLFQRTDGAMKHACAIALSSLQPEPFQKLLWRWLQELLSSDELKIPDLQCAASCWLELNADQGWGQLEQLLSVQYDNHIKSLCVFQNLCARATDPMQFLMLVRHYAHYRRHFTDPQFVQHLVDAFENPELLRFVQAKEMGGDSYRSVFLDAAQVMGMKVSLETERRLQAVDRINREGRQHAVPESLIEVMRSLIPEDKDFESIEMSVLLGFHEDISGEWDSTIVRTQELELLLLHSLPLNWCVRQLESRILVDPSKEREQLERLFSSPLLREEFRDKCIRNLAAETGQSGMQPQLLEDKSGVSHDPKYVLWMLPSGLPSPVVCAYPAMLPKPWQHEIPQLMPALVEQYKKQFQQLAKSGLHEHLDYALELFVRFPDVEIMDLLLRNFNLLINQHFPFFFDFIEKLPDPRFVDKLQDHYREGETTVAQLLYLLCTIHELPIPEHEEFPEPDPVQRGLPQVRIFCSKCRASYHYQLQVLYFDEEAIEQRKPFSNNDLWTPEVILCKNCGVELELQTDSGYRAALYTEMLTKQLLKLTEEEHQRLAAVKPLKFPKYLKRKINPAMFISRYLRESKVKRLSSEEKGQLLLELGKFKLQLNELERAEEALQQSLKLAKNTSAALFFLGVIAYRNKNLYEARLHFSRLVQSTNPQEYDFEDENLHQMAVHYLEILERKDFKRSSFKLIQ